MDLNELLSLIIKYFNQYGYLILFFGLFLENTVFLGLIMPGETILLAASFFAAQGNFNLFIVIIVASIAAIFGNLVGYFLGMKGGRPLLQKYGKYFLISDKRIEWAEKYFDSRGGETVFIGRFVSGIRVFIPFLAGASQMKLNLFFSYTVAAVLLWTTGLGIVGFIFGANIELLKKIIDSIGWVTFAIIVIVIVVFWIYGKYQRRKDYVK